MGPRAHIDQMHPQGSMGPYGPHVTLWPPSALRALIGFFCAEPIWWNRGAWLFQLEDPKQVKNVHLMLGKHPPVIIYYVQTMVYPNYLRKP